MTKYYIIILICMLGSFASCIKQQPQLPANKGNVADSNIAELLEINQNLAVKEDSVLKAYVQHDTSFKKNELGFWYKISNSDKHNLIKNKTNCIFTCKLMLLNGKVLQVDEKNIIIGKRQVVTGLEEGLKLMHKGESATFIIPWYLGYGMKGNEPLVPPYTTLIYQIKLLD